MKPLHYFILLAFFFACARPEKTPVASQKPPVKKPSKTFNRYCQTVEKYFKKYDWGESRCRQQPWQSVRKSVKGHPLLWKTYGVEKNVKEKDNTLILCGVHGDEITPIKFCFDIIKHLDKVVEKNPSIFKDNIVVVAPTANPDSFFKSRPTRTNANGIDINRNFPTKDFYANAIKRWRNRYRAQKRRYPGKKAMSEPETIFQVNLIKRYQPDKIISVHAPLTMLDYDGPSNRIQGGNIGTRANQLLIQMSEKARGYRIKNYPFFTGSLGNYAGNEKNIPTYTLELPTSDARDHRKHWKRFGKAIHSAIFHQIDPDIDMAYKSKEEE